MKKITTTNHVVKELTLGRLKNMLAWVLMETEKPQAIVRFKDEAGNTFKAVDAIYDDLTGETLVLLEQV